MNRYIFSQITSHLDLLVWTWSLVKHDLRTSDVTEFVGVTVQEKERPADGRDFLLYASRSPHQLPPERHPDPTVVVQVVCVIGLHLSEDMDQSNHHTVYCKLLFHDY